MDDTNNNIYEYQKYGKTSQSINKYVQNQIKNVNTIHKLEQQELQNQIQVIDHLSQYQEYFMDVQTKVNQKIEQSNKSIENKMKHKIVTMTQQNDLSMLVDFNTIKKFVIGNQCNGLIIKYQVLLGNFKISIDMINQSTDAPPKLQFIGKGGYGEIFIIPISKNKSIACKRSKFKKKTVIWPENQQGEQLSSKWQISANIAQIHEAILEYSIYQICSFYKIGPSTLDCIGFDLVCFNDAIQFYMQHCDRQFISQNYEQELKICTRILHKMKIIHKDIKPQNILYSQTYQSHVLIDFGISHPVKQQPGQLSKTFRQGTVGYMCFEMEQLMDNKFGYIDLYYNDIYSLQNSLSKIKHFRQRNKNVEQQQSIIRGTINKKINIQYMAIKLIFMLINSDERETTELIREYNLYKLFFEKLKYLQIHLIKYIKIRQNLIASHQNFVKYHTQVNQLSYFSKKQISKQQIQFLVRAYGMSYQLVRELFRYKQNYRTMRIVNGKNIRTMRIQTIEQLKITMDKFWFIKSQQKYLQFMRNAQTQNPNPYYNQIINVSFLIFQFYIQLPIYYEHAKHIFHQISQKQRHQFSTQQFVQYQIISIILQFINNKQKNHINRSRKMLQLIKVYPKEALLAYCSYLKIIWQMVLPNDIVEEYQLIIQTYKHIKLSQLEVKSLIQLKLTMAKLELGISMVKNLIEDIRLLAKQYNLENMYEIQLSLIRGQYELVCCNTVKASEIYSSLIKLIKHNLGPNSYNLLNCKIKLGYCYLVQCQLQKSQLYLLESIQQVSEIYGQRNKDFLNCLVYLIQLYIKLKSVNKVKMYYQKYCQLVNIFSLEQKNRILQLNIFVMKFYFRNGQTSEIQKMMTQGLNRYKNKSQIKHYHYLLIKVNYYLCIRDILKVQQYLKQLNSLTKSIIKYNKFFDIVLIKQYADSCSYAGSQYQQLAIIQYQFIISHTPKSNLLHIQSIYSLGILSFKHKNYKQAYDYFNCALNLLIQQQIDRTDIELQLTLYVAQSLIKMKQCNQTLQILLDLSEKYPDTILRQYSSYYHFKYLISQSYQKLSKAKKVLIQSFKQIRSMYSDINVFRIEKQENLSRNQSEVKIFYPLIIQKLYQIYRNQKIPSYSIYYLEQLSKITNSNIKKIQQHNVYADFFQKYKIKKQRALKYEILSVQINSKADLCNKHLKFINFYIKCHSLPTALILLTFLLEKICRCNNSLQCLSFYKIFEKRFKCRVCNEIVKNGKLVIKAKEKMSQKLKKLSLYKKIEYLNLKLKLSYKLQRMKKL